MSPRGAKAVDAAKNAVAHAGQMSLPNLIKPAANFDGMFGLSEQARGSALKISSLENLNFQS